MKLLFLCTHNACRSILAEAITRKLAGSRLQVASTGSQAVGKVHPLTLHYLQAAGYATEGLHSKPWDALQDFNPDIVITVCDSAAGETCPLWFGKAIKVHWGLPDPSHAPEPDQQRLFAQVINTIEQRINAFLDQHPEQLAPHEWQAILEKPGADE